MVEGDGGEGAGGGCRASEGEQGEEDGGEKGCPGEEACWFCHDARDGSLSMLLKEKRQSDTRREMSRMSSGASHAAR